MLSLSWSALQSGGCRVFESDLLAGEVFELADEITLSTMRVEFRLVEVGVEALGFTVTLTQVAA